MEKLEGPTLFHYMAKLFPNEKIKTTEAIPESVMKQINKILKILDDNHIKHNDLHLSNIMFDKGKPYIIDYGLANIIKGKVKNELIFQN